MHLVAQVEAPAAKVRRDLRVWVGTASVEEAGARSNRAGQGPCEGGSAHGAIVPRGPEKQGQAAK